MKVYHRTRSDVAGLILESQPGEGFRDGRNGYVWLSTIPLDSDQMRSEGADDGGDICLELEVPDDVLEPFGVAKAATRHIAARTVYQIPAERINQAPRRFYSCTQQGMPLAEVNHSLEMARAAGNAEQTRRLEEFLAFYERHGDDEPTRRHKWIELTAYERWQADGEPPDSAERYWLEAEASVDAQGFEPGQYPLF